MSSGELAMSIEVAPTKLVSSFEDYKLMIEFCN